MIKQEIRLSSAIIVWFSWFIILSPSFPIYAQVQDNQAVPSDEGEPAKIRCSDGSLVVTGAECPSDQCPSSLPSGNNIIQCIPNTTLQERTLNASLRQVGNSKQFQNINITTDKKLYKPEEIVNIIVRNTGAVALTFPNSILGLTIQSAVTHEKYPLISTQVITTLDSGGQKTVRWDQTDSFGQQVKAGNYTASTSSGLINANTTFSVVK